MWRVSAQLDGKEAAFLRLPEGLEAVAGRCSSANLQISERSVSRRHCLMRARADGVEFVDLGSANGLHLGNERVRQVVITPGQKLKVGLATLSVEPDLEQTGILPALREPISPEESSLDLNQSVISQRAYGVMARDRLAVLIEAGKSLASVVDLDALFERIMDNLFQILDVDRAVLVLQEADGSLAARTMRPESDQAELSEICSRSIIRQVLRTRKAVVFNDAVRDRELDHAQSIRLTDIRAAIAAPLMSHRRCLGVLYADYPGRANLYSESDLDFLTAFASLCGICLENARMQEELRKRERLQRDVEIAAEIQQSLLPASDLEDQGLDADWVYRPARQVGGDFYDSFHLDDGRIAMVLGDVSGKGIGAALMMARLTSCMRAVVPDCPDPGAVLRRTNRLIQSAPGRVTFATACYVLLDPDRGQLAFASAGHNPALILSPGGDEFFELGATGLPLCILPEAEYETRIVDLPQGALLFLYTDGIVEARDRHGEFFGMERLQALLLVHRDESAKRIIARLLGALSQHCQQSSYTQDDIALCVVKRR